VPVGFAAVLVCAALVTGSGAPLEFKVTLGAMVTLAGAAGVVTVVVLCTVVVFDVTVGTVAVVLPESPLEMIAAAIPPSASTSTTTKAIIHPLVPDPRCGAADAGA
jgi:hypothetical protein